MQLDKLELTPLTRNFLRRREITNDMLENLDLPTFDKTYHANAKITQELLNLGFLKSATGEKYIRELPDISSRLKNCLKSYNIYQLSELQYLTERDIKAMRNMGDKTFNELMEICEKHQKNIYKMPAEIPMKWKRRRDYQTLENYFAKAQIGSLEIFENITPYDLYNMVEQKFVLAAIIYNFLSDIQTFKQWDNAFTFEYLDIYYARRFYKKFDIMYMSELDALRKNSDIKWLEHYKYPISSSLRKWNKSQCNRQ